MANWNLIKTHYHDLNVISVLQQSETYPTWDEESQSIVQESIPVTGGFDFRTLVGLVYAIREVPASKDEAMQSANTLQHEREVLDQQ